MEEKEEMTNHDMKQKIKMKKNEENKEEKYSMEKNWKLFIKMTRTKSESHSKSAWYWDSMHNILSISCIILGTITTFLSLINSIPSSTISGAAAFTTFISAISALLEPSDRRQIQSDAAKTFKILMMRMARCKTEKKYDELWGEFYNAVTDEPFILEKFIEKDEEKKLFEEWSMTPELQAVMVEKIKKKESLSNKNDMGIKTSDQELIEQQQQNH